MPGKTATFTVTDAADVPVTAMTETPDILVAEDPSVEGWPTTPFLVKKPTGADDPIQRPDGASYTFSKGNDYRGGPRPYVAGEIAGYVRLPTGKGSTTFQQDETGF